MVYRFKLDEALHQGVRRIARGQMERVADHLRPIHLNPAADAEAGTDAKRIHEARKGLKRARALLRLVRAGLPPDVFASENASLQAIASSIAGERERVSLRTAIAWLAPVIDDPRAIKALQAAVAPSASNRGSAISLERGGADAAALRLAALDVAGSGQQVIEAGLRRCQRQYRRAVAAAIETGDEDAFHEWRKAVQWHWRHMQLLSPAWPQFCKARLESARRVSQLLGNDHDLAQLAALARNAGLSSQAQPKVVRVIETQQAMLRAAAALDGQRLAADRPKALARQICGYWRAAGGA
jgi:CHAD domain-containing protein